MHRAGSTRRPFLFAVILPLLAGCVAPRQVRDFAENAQGHPDQAAVVDGVPAYSAAKPNTSFEPLAAVLQYWKKPVSAGDVEQWYADHSLSLAAEDKPVRCAWEHGLWAFGQNGTPDALKMRLRSGIPVMVILQDDALDEATRRFAVVMGYDDLDKRVLYRAGGPEPVVAAYSDFFSAWRAAFNWMLTVCPTNRIAWTPDPGEIAARGQFHEASGRTDEAIADYEAAIASGLRRSSLLVRLGNCYRSHGNSKKAEAAYRDAIALDHHNGRAYNNLAYLLAERSEHLDEAVSLARQAMLLEPTNPLAIDTLGFALYQQGNYKEASEVLERARARARWSPVAAQTEIGLHLAWAHVKAGSSHLAKEVLADILRIDPSAEIPPELRKQAGAE